MIQFIYAVFFILLAAAGYAILLAVGFFLVIVPLILVHEVFLWLWERLTDDRSADD